ncbi:heat stress transcription factor C-2a-like [Setaria italica]|nr:heat stress transcription factor C-2a-like [Setaria italica]
MVDDPSTDGVIAWGRANNSFVVADPFVFARTLLPAHFKHSTSPASCASSTHTCARVAVEVVRLRREQRANEEQLVAMRRRVQETERRPRQMLALLARAGGDVDAMAVDGVRGSVPTVSNPSGGSLLLSDRS